MKSITKFEQNVNFKLVTGTGEILQDFSSTGKERPWKIHKQENLRLVEIYKLAKHERLISACLPSFIFFIENIDFLSLIKKFLCLS